jgi:hypothetical protein
LFNLGENMTALELMTRLGGEVLNNKIRANIDGEIVIVARLQDQDWVLTDRGVLLANEHSNLAVAETATTKTRKTKAQLVESVEITDEPSVGLAQAAE